MYTLIKHNLTGSIFHCRIVLATVLMGGSKSDRVAQIDRTAGQLIYVYTRDVMTQCHARISRENLPVTLKLENIIISLPL